MTIDPPVFRDAMARLGAAVSVVTTDGPGGLAGMTASAVCSVTDTPPTLLVCINRASPSCDVFASNGVLCVNALASGQRAISDRFAGRTGLASANRFDDTEWGRLVTGAPLLAGACFVRLPHLRSPRQGNARDLLCRSRGRHPWRAGGSRSDVFRPRVSLRRTKAWLPCSQRRRVGLIRGFRLDHVRTTPGSVVVRVTTREC